jgi:phage-related protein|tara:strand:+ start:375 stop:746 length:372 start_codon:yes stop_codon:yes gene_type:complete
MATFDDATVGTSTGGTTPDFGAVRRSAPKVRRVQFGDGYEKRLTYGLNQDPKVWDLKWTAKTSTDANKIEAFFDARAADNAAFDWSPINDTSTYKWVVDQYSRNHRYADVNEITATFRQVFEP